MMLRCCYGVAMWFLGFSGGCYSVTMWILGCSSDD